MNPESPASPTVCYRHPNRETGLHCTRCGRPICPECARATDVGHRCPDCLHTLRSRYFVQGGYLNPLSTPQSPPLFTYGLIGLLALIWLWQEYLAGGSNGRALIQQGAAVGFLILRGEIWRLGTAMFLHGGALHLAFNCFALFTLGRFMEGQFGHARFVSIFLLAGYAGSLLSFAWSGPRQFSVGASGGVFGIVGAEMGFLFFHRQALGQLGQARQRQLLTMLIVNLIFGFSVPGIDNLGHIGGLIGGLVLGYLLAPRYIPALNSQGQNFYQDQAALSQRWWVIVGMGLSLLAITWSLILFWQGQ